jgi:hypothetical protein
VEGTKSHECENDQCGADNQQPPLGAPAGEHKPNQRRGDDDNQLHKHTGVGAGKKKINDEFHNSNTSR